jgi:hypothetical protein
MNVIYYNKTSHVIETIYEFPDGESWAIDHSDPNSVTQVNIHKGKQSDNITDVTTQEQAAAYYLANKDKLLEAWHFTCNDKQGHVVELDITEGKQPDGKDFKNADEAAAELVNRGLTVVDVQTYTKELIEMALLQNRKVNEQLIEE